MNRNRRKAISSLIEQLDGILQEIDCIKEEEEQAYDNLPYSLQNSEQGEMMQDYIDRLESVSSTLSDEVINEMQSIVDGD